MNHSKAMSGNLTLAAFTAALSMAGAVHAQDCSTIRASVSSSGDPGTGVSSATDISFDGRFVGFSSYASNLVPGDQNGHPDGFIRDAKLGVTERVSVTEQGGECNAGSGLVLVSDDGRFVCFSTSATNVVPDDTDDLVDLYMRDRLSGTTTRITQRLPGKPSVWHAQFPDMSADGRFVVFESFDPNFVVGDTNGSFDAFLWDRLSGQIERISLGPNGQQGTNGQSGTPQVSDDGRFVLFGTTVPDWGFPINPAIAQLALRDRLMQTTTLVSVSNSGQPSSGPCGNPDLSGDGRVAVFQANNADLTPESIPSGGWHIYARDLVKQETTALSLNKDGVQTLALNYDPRVSTDGRLVVFHSYQNDLVALDGNSARDVFLHDLSTGVTELVSKGDRNQFASGPGKACYGSFISGDGRSVMWNSLDNKLVTPWSPFTDQVYVRKCDPNPATIFCAWLPNSMGCTPEVTLTGDSSASAGSGHVLECTKLVSGSIGLMYYGTQGTQALVLSGFYQCIAPPVLRTPGKSTGGPISPADCTGTLSFDFNSWIVSGSDPSLTAGTAVYAQFWSRDAQSPSKMHFSPAAAFVIGP